MVALAMKGRAPVAEISARYVDEFTAREVAAALNLWFRWIVKGSETPVPEVFEPFGIATADYAWVLDDDVDWELGPHARAVGDEVRISLHTHDTHLHVSGLLRKLGGESPKVVRDA